MEKREKITKLADEFKDIAFSNMGIINGAGSYLQPKESFLKIKCFLDNVKSEEIFEFIFYVEKSLGKNLLSEVKHSIVEFLFKHFSRKGKLKINSFVAEYIYFKIQNISKVKTEDELHSGIATSAYLDYLKMVSLTSEYEEILNR